MRYFDLIFTLHAQNQMEARGIKIADAWETFKHPSSTKTNKYSKGLDFEREFDNFKITAVAFQNIRNEWIVKSVWRNPALPGTSDAKQKNLGQQYNKAGTLGKIWIQIKQQLGF